MQVVPGVIHTCPASLPFRQQLCQLHLQIVADQPELASTLLLVLPLLHTGDEILSATLSKGLRAIFERCSAVDVEDAIKVASGVKEKAR